MINWRGLAGKRFVLDKGEVIDVLADDAVVEIWVCQRVDEPWMWRRLPNQYVERCRKCDAEIVVAISARSPRNPDVVKLCRHCAVRLSLDEAPRVQ